LIWSQSDRNRWQSQGATFQRCHTTTANGEIGPRHQPRHVFAIQNGMDAQPVVTQAFSYLARTPQYEVDSCVGERDLDGLDNDR
jgi:hypothetical protein